MEASGGNEAEKVSVSNLKEEETGNRQVSIYNDFRW